MCFALPRGLTGRRLSYAWYQSRPATVLFQLGFGLERPSAFIPFTRYLRTPPLEGVSEHGRGTTVPLVLGCSAVAVVTSTVVLQIVGALEGRPGARTLAGSHVDYITGATPSRCSPKIGRAHV